MYGPALLFLAQDAPTVEWIRSLTSAGGVTVLVGVGIAVSRGWLVLGRELENLKKERENDVQRLTAELEKAHNTIDRVLDMAERGQQITRGTLHAALEITGGTKEASK